MAETTISEEYRSEQKRLHENANYGVASIGYAPLVGSLLELGRCASLSDYGAGKCKLKSALGGSMAGIDYFPYDPAFPEYGPPTEADLVTCIDVLEHVEPDRLDATLDEIASMTRRLALMTVHTGPARKTLSDGRNAHLTQQKADWWLPRLDERFDLLHVKPVRKGFFVVACRKGLRDQLEEETDMAALRRRAARHNPRPNLPRRIIRWVKRTFAGLPASSG